jgi:hypothetical protein
MEPSDDDKIPLCEILYFVGSRGLLVELSRCGCPIDQKMVAVQGSLYAPTQLTFILNPQSEDAPCRGDMFPKHGKVVPYVTKLFCSSGTTLRVVPSLCRFSVLQHNAAGCVPAASSRSRTRPFYRRSDWEISKYDVESKTTERVVTRKPLRQSAVL